MSDRYEIATGKTPEEEKPEPEKKFIPKFGTDPPLDPYRHQPAQTGRFPIIRQDSGTEEGTARVPDTVQIPPDMLDQLVDFTGRRRSNGFTGLPRRLRMTGPNGQSVTVPLESASVEFEGNNIDIVQLTIRIPRDDAMRLLEGT